jgi:hypothetical protein
VHHIGAGRVLQPGSERGNGLVGVVLGPVEPEAERMRRVANFQGAAYTLAGKQMRPLTIELRSVSVPVSVVSWLERTGEASGRISA